MVDEFPFEALPMELREMVLKKVSIKDSMKLLGVNRQLRDYVLYWGPFHKKIIDWMEITFRRHVVELDLDGQELITNFGDASGSPDDLTINCSKEISMKLLKNIASPRMLWISTSFPSNRFRMILPEFLSRIEFLHSFKLHLFDIQALNAVLAIIQPKVAARFELDCARHPRAGLTQTNGLGVMLRDCKEVRIDRTFASFYQVLQGTNVPRILVKIAGDATEAVQMVLENGVPSRHPMAELHLRIPLSEAENISNLVNGALPSVSLAREKGKKYASMILEAFGDQHLTSESFRAQELDVFRKDDWFYFLYRPSSESHLFGLRWGRDDLHFSVMNFQSRLPF